MKCKALATEKIIQLPFFNLIWVKQKHIYNSASSIQLSGEKVNTATKFALRMRALVGMWSLTNKLWTFTTTDAYHCWLKGSKQEHWIYMSNGCRNNTFIFTAKKVKILKAGIKKIFLSSQNFPILSLKEEHWWSHASALDSCPLKMRYYCFPRKTLAL